MKLVYISKKWIMFVSFCFLAAVTSWYVVDRETLPTAQDQNQEFVINMVTGEFKSKTEDGKEIEAYRWDPGTIYIPKGQNVKLSIYGVNGKEHPFMIEGTDIKGTVTKGKETIVNLNFSEEGIYRLICLTHPDIAHNGPMIAYIVVD
jgi:heme/copper-type cytochrome/quinol oxidase subunit 2